MDELHKLMKFEVGLWTVIALLWAFGIFGLSQFIQRWKEAKKSKIWLIPVGLILIGGLIFITNFFANIAQMNSKEIKSACKNIAVTVTSDNLEHTDVVEICRRKTNDD